MIFAIVCWLASMCLLVSTEKWYVVMVHASVRIHEVDFPADTFKFVY